MDYFEKSIEIHKAIKGKLSIQPKINLITKEDLSTAYSPGIAGPSKVIAENPEAVWELTIKANTVAVVSDGSAVLGLGNIGPEAAIPVMEGKAILFKKFAGIDAFPICLATQDTDEIVETVKRIAPVFGGINLEDISAPRSFEIEERLQDIGIPVFHDDQHGTAIVLLAALINSARVLNKKIEDLKVVVNGAGAAGIAITRMLRCINFDDTVCVPINDIIVCDSKGIIHKERENLTSVKKELLNYSNRENRTGGLKDAIKGMDVFIGVSIGNLLTAEDIRTMNPDSIILAMANPIPEIMPDEALKGGAAIVGTGRSDFHNQVNNVLAFPGIFRGALNTRAKRITPKMKLAAAYALAECIEHPVAKKILPSTLDMQVVGKVSQAVMEAYEG